jgi:hypothetical protein
MYADPALIREHVVKLRLNDSEADLIEALVNYTGQQKAPLLRDLLLEQARLVLAGEANCEPARATSEGPQRDLFRGASVAASGTGTGP